jgi:hypothetical protein
MAGRRWRPQCLQIARDFAGVARASVNAADLS